MSMGNGRGSPNGGLPRRERRRKQAEKRRNRRIDGRRIEARWMHGCGAIHIVTILADGTEVHAHLWPDQAKRFTTEVLRVTTFAEAPAANTPELPS